MQFYVARLPWKLKLKRAVNIQSFELSVLCSVGKKIHETLTEPSLFSEKL